MFDYNSPIEVFQKQIETKMEDGILKAVQKMGVNVDKDELLKALKYDREQYEKGYDAGFNADKWIPVSERLPEECELVLCTAKDIDIVFVGRYENIDGVGFRWFDYDNFSMSVIAWMPLPEPYEGGKDND